MSPDREFRAQLRDRGAYPVMAGATVVLVALIGISLLPAHGGRGMSDAASAPPPSLVPSHTPSPPRAAVVGPAASGSATAPGPGEAAGIEIPPGTYGVPWDRFSIQLTVPAGWLSSDAGATVSKDDEGGLYNAPTLSVHAVTRVATRPCAVPRLFEEVGPTVEDLTTALTTALANQVGIESVGPVDVVLAGYPAKKFVLTIPGTCPDPAEGTLIWQNNSDTAFGLLEGGTGTIYIVDVDGERLVITSHYRGASAGAIAELGAIVDSIAIVPEPVPPPPEEWAFPPAGELAPGWYTAVVDSNPPNPSSPDGFGFLFRVPTSGWISSGPNADGIGGHISKGTTGSPEGVVIRFGSPDRVYLDPCAHPAGPPVGPSVADLAAAMATIPGTEVRQTSDVRLRWSTAKYLVLSVRGDLECAPWEFYLWDDPVEGPRRATAPGSTVRVWIFNPNDRPIFGRVVVEAETYEGAGPEIEREIEQIVSSIDHGG